MKPSDIVHTLRHDVALLNHTVVNDVCNSSSSRIFILEGSSGTGKTSFCKFFNHPPNQLSYCFDYQSLVKSKVGSPLTDRFMDKCIDISSTRFFPNQLYTSHISCAFGIIMDKIRDSCLLSKPCRTTHVFDRSLVSNIIYDMMFDRYASAKHMTDKAIDSCFDTLISEGLLLLPDMHACLQKDCKTFAEMIVILQNENKTLIPRLNCPLDLIFEKMFGDLNSYAHYQNRWFRAFVSAIRRYEERTGEVYNVYLTEVETYFKDSSMGHMITNIASMIN